MRGEVMSCFFFFFSSRRRHTRFDCDWSSDVCSSDLELHTIKVPTLVITGSQDTLTPVGDAEELAELIPDARLYVLSGAAHRSEERRVGKEWRSRWSPDH